MIPELLITMLACSRIGAIHAVVFSGFSTISLLDRIDDSKSKVIVTADVGSRKGSIIKLQEIVGEAIKDLDFVKHVVVLKRTNSQSNLLAKHHLWNELMDNSPDELEIQQLMIKSQIYGTNWWIIHLMSV